MQGLLDGETVNIRMQKCYYIQAVLIMTPTFFMGIVTFKNGWLRKCRCYKDSPNMIMASEGVLFKL